MKKFFKKMWVMDSFDGRGIWERVKECKRQLECNRPLSPSLSTTNELVQKIGKDIKNKKMVYKND